MKLRLSKGNLSFQGSSDDEPLIKSVNPSKSQNKRKRGDDDNDDGGDEENKMVGKTKRSRLEESSPGICILVEFVLVLFPHWMLRE